MKGDIQPPFSEVAYKSQDPIEHNTIPLFDHTPDTRLHLDFVQQDVHPRVQNNKKGLRFWLLRKLLGLKKGKEKVIEFDPPKFVKSYSTHGAQKKFFSDSMVAKKAQKPQNRRKRNNIMSEVTTVLPKDLVDLLRKPDDSATESKDIIRAVNKIRKL
ncbi:hypothetical protein KY284_010523 [Solanum tuberosum]|nr:hypothetical protein KY284_010523 [Solanum tuberosum]